MTTLPHITKCLPRKATHACCIAIISFLMCLSSVANAQYFDLQGGRKHVTIPFRMIRNLMIIKLKINGKGPFNFILDSGVGLMLITDPKMVDSINLSNQRTIKIAGLGEGEAYEAYITSQLKIDIPGLVSYDVGAAILKTDHFGLSDFVGIPIQGLLGYEFFSAVAVQIDFNDSTLTVSKPKDAGHFRKGGKIPLHIEDRKAYLQAKVVFPDGVKANEKLIFDLGAVHPISLENMANKQGPLQKSIAANLGVGLTGPISGVLGRLAEVDIGKYKLKDVITSFPDYKVMPKTMVQRDGNLGIGLLKRFIMIIDYPDSVLYVKPGPTMADPFEHDMSGLEYFKTGEDYDHIVISRVEHGSPGDEIGLEPGDEIMAINFQSVAKMSLEEVDEIFKSRPGRSLLLKVYHDKKYDNVILMLRRRI